MMNPKPFQRRIAIVLLAIFLPSLFPVNLLYANNNGPKTPEAASFEPVDATDMVNLVTGQYSYVLPLLNVPSPEGGYPIALSYHAGVTLEQQASWTGLGWNLNPGAIDRNINGYPDDYNASKINEYFYDSGSTTTINNLSIGYSDPTSMASVGLSFSWTGNQALGGAVNIGYGPVSGSFGSNGAGVGVQYGGLSLGADISDKGKVNGEIGFGNNDAGFSISTSGSGSFRAGIVNMSVSENSIGITLSSSKKNSSGGYDKQGVGLSVSFNNTFSMNDYSTSSSSWAIPIYVPTPIGNFSLTFGQQKFKYWMGQNKSNYITGPIYFHKGVTNIPKINNVFQQHPHSGYISCGITPNGGFCNIIGFGPHNSAQTGYNNFHNVWFLCESHNGNPVNSCYKYFQYQGGPQLILQPHSTITQAISYEKAFMDINEISLKEGTLNEFSIPEVNNPTFPNYDNYNVNSQGFSGSLTSIHHENGALFGLSEMMNKDGYQTMYAIDGATSQNNIPSHAKFNDKPKFYVQNEISTFINVTKANFNNLSSNSDILQYYFNGVDDLPKPRKKTATFVEYYTNEEILDNYNTLKQNGYLQPSVTSFDRTTLPKESIGAFKVTTVDGKTYHYSLPVYNHEMVTRTFGQIQNRRQENQAYFEKRQLDPYVTHWLLTAVTGPDFIDNGDGVAGEGDLGYWTDFEYGKWTEAFIWKAPYGKDYISDKETPYIKTWIKGRKELYYLDKIKTRTHTALFIKSVREDGKSHSWNYKSVSHTANPGNYEDRFTIPSTKQLKLDKIILIKNENNDLQKDYGSNIEINKNMGFVNSDKSNFSVKMDLYDNVIDINDNLNNVTSNAVKIIDFNYDYNLVKGSDRLALKKIDFKGKSGSNVIPPYKFSYIEDSNNINYNNIDDWGFHKTKPEVYSLKEILTPQGAKIKIEYEPHQFHEVFGGNVKAFNDYMFYHYSNNKLHPNYQIYKSPDNKLILYTKNGYMDRILLNDLFKIKWRGRNSPFISIDWLNPEASSTCNVDIIGKVISSEVRNINSTQVHPSDMFAHAAGDINDPLHTYNKFIIDPLSPFPSCYSVPVASYFLGVEQYEYPDRIYSGAGVRVKNIIVADENTSYRTNYNYNDINNNISSGYVSYNPFNTESKEIAYSAELPAPRVMYEYVTVQNFDQSNNSNGKIQYKFKILKSKVPGQIKFDDFYEITKTDNVINNTTSNVNVQISDYVVKDNFSTLGQLLEIKNYNNNNQLLSKLSNNYYSISNLPNDIGVVKESYQTYKKIDYENNSIRQDKWGINSTTRISYPSIIKSSSEQKDGYTYTTEFNDYDLISGISKEQLHTSSDGKSFKTKIVPAYLKYPQMGSKVDNINNKNMLSQTAMELSYILDGGAWKETGVGITTWSNLWSYKDIAGVTTTPTADKEKIWRKHKTYTWNGVKDVNGIFTNYTSATDDGFDWTVGVGQPVGSEWKQISEVTLYDHYSMPLEVKDINSNKAAIKMGDRDTKVMTTGNAGYNEMYYAGAENIDNTIAWLEPEVKAVGVLRDASKSHTGKYSIAATSSSQFGVDMKVNQHRAGKYKLSVWVHKLNESKARFKTSVGATPVTFNGESVTAGDWVLKTHYFDVTVAAINPIVCSADGSTVYFDDLMIRPIASSITGYVYNDYDELTHIIGNNGLATRFEYDAAGRLVKTYVEIVDDPANSVIGGFKLKSENKYHYKNL